MPDCVLPLHVTMYYLIGMVPNLGTLGGLRPQIFFFSKIESNANIFSICKSWMRRGCQNRNYYIKAQIEHNLHSNAFFQLWIWPSERHLGAKCFNQKSTFLYYIFWYIGFGCPQMAFTVTFLTFFTKLGYFQVDFEWFLASKMVIWGHRGH